MQKHHSFFCAGLWPFIVLPLLLASIVIFFNWEKIEYNVALNAQQKLNDDYSWSTVENFNRGRDILLTGTAPSQSEVEGALTAARTAPGVRSTHFVGQISPVLLPAQISIQFEGNDVVLSGHVNNNSTKKSIIDDARVKLGQRSVIDQLQVSSDYGSAPDISGLLATASLLGDGAQLSMDGDKLTVQGKVRNIDQKNSLAARFASAFSGSVENNLTVDLHQQCIDKLSALLSENMIYFDSGTTTIQAQSNAVINTIFDTISGCPEIEFMVAGHTDSTGSSAANLALSQERAQSVVEQLVTLGLKADRFTANGYGAETPIQSNETEAGRAANRRIEFKLKE